MTDDAIGLLLAAMVFVGLLAAIVVFGVAIGSVLLIGGVPGAIGYAIYWQQVKSPTAREQRAKERTDTLYRAVRSKFTVIDVPAYLERHIDFDGDGHNADIQRSIAEQLLALEGLDAYPPEPPTLCDTIEGGKYRDFLNQVSPEDYEKRLAHIARVTGLCTLKPTTENIANLIYVAVEDFDDERSILPQLTKRIDENYKAEKSVPPQDYQGDDIIRAYLKNTPLEQVKGMVHDDSITIPHALRNQHHAIVAGTGHGKTQCLQQMLLEDIEDRDSCVIVIDSQGSMLEKLLHVVEWERVMYLDGGNIGSPLALAAFSVGSTSRPEDEPKVRTAVALYEHMFAARETALTTTQSTLYRFLSRFLMVIPSANFETALEILQDGYEACTEYVAELDETSQKFVTTQLCSPKDKSASQSYRTTRQEVARRLFTLMESRTLKGMFNAPESKVDIPAAIRDKKIILINTAQGVLGDEGAQLFGKYCFAQIAMEVLARPETQDRVYLYLDEAQEYLSDTPIIRRLYEQGRKRGLCMITSCQELDQLERAGIDKMMNSLTSIKFAGGVSAGDAGKLAREMDTNADMIRAVPTLTFAAWLKHHGTGTYRVTPGLLEDRIAAEPEDIETLKEIMLARYHYDPAAAAKDEEGEGDTGDDEAAAAPADEPNFDDYWSDDPADDASSNPPGSGAGKRSRADEPSIDPDAPQLLD